MQYEVELKFPLEDPTEILSKLDEIGAECGSTVNQRDTYYAHPQRDFAETDEALRIRCVGDQNRITYKGPIVDSQTKTRHEIELSFSDGPETADQLGQLLEAISFRRVRSVNKQRTFFSLEWNNRPIEFALDEVDELGLFLEIETIAEESDRDDARDCILDLAARLNLEHAERRSYLCLLLAMQD